MIIADIKGSSTVAGVGWENESLYVDFIKGTRYRYDGVPVKVYEDMIKADSVGQFLHREIKGRYNFTKLPTDLTESANV